MRFHWPYILPSFSAFSQHFIRVSSTNVKWKTSHGNRFLPYILIYWNCSKNIIQVNRRFVVLYFKFAISYLNLDPSLWRLQSSTRMRQTRRIQKNPPWKAVLTDVVSVSRFTGFEWTEGLFDKHLGGLNPYSCGRGFNKHLQRNRVSWNIAELGSDIYTR